VPIILKSETLKLLETSGPIQGYNGIGLPLRKMGDTQQVPYQAFTKISSHFTNFYGHGDLALHSFCTPDFNYFCEKEEASSISALCKVRLCCGA